MYAILKGKQLSFPWGPHGKIACFHADCVLVWEQVDGIPGRRLQCLQHNQYALIFHRQSIRWGEEMELVLLSIRKTPISYS